MTDGLDVSDLAGLVYPYLTFSEATQSARVEFLKSGLQNSGMRRAVGPSHRLRLRRA